MLIGHTDWGRPASHGACKRSYDEKVNNIPIDEVATEPLLAEVIAAMADYEAKEAGSDPIPRTSVASGELDMDNDDPVVVRIAVPVNTPTGYRS